MRFFNRLKLRGNLVYFIFACIALCLFVGLVIMKNCSVSIGDARIVYGKYTLSAANAEKKAIIMNYLLITFSMLILIYLFLWLLDIQRNFRKRAIIVSVFLFCFLISVMYILGCTYFKRERVKIVPQSELEFNLVEIYGDDIEFTDEFEKDVYQYYVTFADAYNNLMITGDYECFFNSFDVEKIEKLNTVFSDIIQMQNNTTGEGVSVDTVIKSGTEYSPKQFPAHSMSKGTMLLLYFRYGEYDLTDAEEVQIAIDASLCGINTMLDVFYGKELIAEEEFDYSTYKKNRKNTYMNIQSLELNRSGNGKISFTYYGQPYTCVVKNRICRFTYLEEPVLIHFTKSDITVNGIMAPRNTLH